MHKIFRAPPSRYFPPDFIARERARLSQITGLQWVDELDRADIFISNTHTPFESLAPAGKLDHLKLILHPNSGFDRMPHAFAATAKTLLCGGNPIRAHAVSNYVLRALLDATAPSPYHPRWDDARHWGRRPLTGMTMRLIGYGHIGKLVHAWAQALGMVVDIDDPYFNLRPNRQIQELDVVVLCCSLNRSNHSMLDRSWAEALPENAIIINPARGELINWPDLLQVLERRKDLRAYIDVYEQEPYPGGTFPALANLKTSCHVAGVDEKLADRTIEFEYHWLELFCRSSAEEFRRQAGPLLLNGRNQDDFLR